jgi:hypothetical protein
MSHIPADARGLPRGGHTTSHQTRDHADMLKRRDIHHRLAPIDPGENASSVDVTKPYDRANQRLKLFTEREKERRHVYVNDKHALDKLVGMNDGPRTKAPTLVERYPHEWAELHTPQEKLDYEARMRKYKPQEFFTPYGKEWHDVNQPRFSGVFSS